MSTSTAVNQLTLNHSKREYMIDMIVGSNRRINQIDIQPRIHNVIKSLGVKIDEILSWNAQVNQVTKKVNAGLIVVRRL